MVLKAIGGKYRSPMILIFLIVCVSYVYNVPVWCIRRQEEDIRSSSGVNISCETLCEYWESNLCLQEKQPILLKFEPSFQRQGLIFIKREREMPWFDVKRLISRQKWNFQSADVKEVIQRIIGVGHLQWFH